MDYSYNTHIKDNQMYLGKYKMSDLAYKFGTPLIVYDYQDIVNNINIFKKHLGIPNINIQIVYASKAFLNYEICNIMNKNNLMIDAVSLGDLEVIKRSGFNLSKCVLHGNNKSEEEIEFAIKENIGILVVDNLFELEIINKISNNIQKNVRIMLRVNPGIEAHTHYYVQTSLISSKFGESIFDNKVMSEIVKIIKSNKYLDFLGFHCHIGSQITEIKPFIACAKTMFEFVNDFSNKHNITINELNLGGGFGINYLNENFNLVTALDEYARSLKELVSNSTIKKIYFEPGRSIVGLSGTTLYRASQVKTTYGNKKYLFVDGGMSDNIRPALYQAKYRVINVNDVIPHEPLKMDVVGSCCESGDIVAQDVMLSYNKSGDVYAVIGTGAYCYAMSSNYNNFLKPTIIMIDDDIKIISRKETIDDLVRLF